MLLTKCYAAQSALLYYLISTLAEENLKPYDVLIEILTERGYTLFLRALIKVLPHLQLLF